MLHDYSGGAGALMDHLIALGHRRIALIHGVARPALGADRLLAYRRAIRGAGLGVEERLVVRCGSTPGDGVAAARRLLARNPRPTAIVGVNDLMAIGALQAAAQCGLQAPRDLSVAGFDDIELAGYVVPPLTTVRADGEEGGRQAALLLFRRRRDPDLAPQRIVLPTGLRVRQSTGPRPG